MDRSPDRPSADAAVLAKGRGRHAARDSLLLTARLRIGENAADVRIRNLSAGGLMAEYPRPVSLGEPVEIDVRGIGPVVGRIAWATDGRVGIAFDEPIDPMLARKPVTSRKAKGSDSSWLHVYPAATPPRLKR
ncbi:hypothetical protein COC42_14420 [Sphingomonas spermidinifaciens]|uniref:PilZ domain-containing protein n=1 Tax=Sphingomonas spermidinifaciens TaxID=1141889 RepID=A0A2A4B3Q5_9SPHN|nr:PilZ domain-containing protein [Sphingomonas spermidinifaciens]PCD02592.1 hypothetical protein COC42_14420 [Sphingomonas spermidinifaciens]